MNVFDKIQHFGRSVMLAIAVLPVAGILIGVGGHPAIDIPIMFVAGNAIFANLPLIFAIAVAVGLAKNNDGAAALSAAIGYFVITNVTATMDSTINMGILSGIVSGILAAYLYNRYHTIQLPEFLAFFAGRRFIPIITGLSAFGFGLVFGIIWPPIQGGIDSLALAMGEAGAFGAAAYGFLNRLLIPTGLHHVLNTYIWFNLGDFTDAAGELVRGDLSRFYAGDPTAGVYTSGYFPIMMGGMVGACGAMIVTAKTARRKFAVGVLISAALTSFVTGVTEPVEFAFLFVAPLLFVVHALLTAVSLFIAYSLNIHLAFTFSAGLIDFVLSYSRGQNSALLLILIPMFAVIYFVVFLFVIKLFDLKTPGRETDAGMADMEGANAATAANTSNAAGAGSAMAASYADALGGMDNILTIDNCTTRLRLTIQDHDVVNADALKALGAKGVVKSGGNSLQVIVGTKVEAVARELKDLKRGS